MSLTSALSNAKSGLVATARSADIVANNVANAMTEGYGRREVRLSASSLGGFGAGVSVTSVERIINLSAMNERRMAEASLSFEQERSQFLKSLEFNIGGVDSPTSLNARFSDFEAALVGATSSPEDEGQLSLVLEAAQNLVVTINSAANDIQKSREQADTNIYEAVEALNSSLENIVSLNSQIRSQLASSGNANGLMDERQRIIDSISHIIPLKQVEGEFGTVKIMTQNGTTLADSSSARFSFYRTPTITPDMTLASGALSGLTISGASSSVGDVSSIIDGGFLSSQFEVRDTLSIQWTNEIDMISEDLISNFSDPILDTTLGTSVGLFTDQGGSIMPGDEVGVSSRLEINPAVDPAQGGAIWRLRDGIGSLVQGPVGNTAILGGFLNVLQGKDPTGATDVSPSFVSKSITLVSSLSGARVSSENSQAFFEASRLAFASDELSVAVDTDQELQSLLLIEQSYAANAQVLATIDEMLQSILRV